MYEYKATIRRVVDGDTVDVDIDLGFGVIMANQRIRLKGIDTPESRTRDLVEKKFGKLAARFLTEQLGETCTLRTTKDKKGKFGRILGEFITKDSEGISLSINELMISENMAVEYYGQSKDDVESEHLLNRQLLIAQGKYEI